MGASDSLLTTRHTEEISKELSNEIFKASKRLNRLIENLLNMSRLESGRITTRLDWCDIHDLVNKVTESLQDELKPFSIHIVIPDDMPFVKLDFGLMEQVLYNLIYNATQYAYTSTNLRIKAFYDNGILTLQVMDRGPGFPAKEISLIFNKFYRVEGSKSGRYQIRVYRSLKDLLKLIREQLLLKTDRMEEQNLLLEYQLKFRHLTWVKNKY